MLFEDYGFPEGVLSVQHDNEEIKRAIDLITEESSCVEIKNKLVTESNRQKRLVERMWDEIFEEIMKA